MELTRENIEKLLMTNNNAVIRALYALNDRQTRDEQASETTKYHNNKGFKPCDAKKGTGMVRFHMMRGYLTNNQINYWRKPLPSSGKPRICAYANQLIIVANEKKEGRAVQNG